MQAVAIWISSSDGRMLSHRSRTRETWNAFFSPVHHINAMWPVLLIFGVCSYLGVCHSVWHFPLRLQSWHVLHWCLFCTLGRNNPNMALSWWRTSRFGSRISEVGVFFLWVKDTSIYLPLSRDCLNISLSVTEEQCSHQCEEFKIQLKPLIRSCFCLW